jgi:hypothetical protein
MFSTVRNHPIGVCYVHYFRLIPYEETVHCADWVQCAYIKMPSVSSVHISQYTRALNSQCYNLELSVTERKFE